MRSSKPSGKSHIECAQCCLYETCEPLSLGGIEISVKDALVERRLPVAKGEILPLEEHGEHYLYAITKGSFKLVQRLPHAAQPQAATCLGFRFAAELIGETALTSQHNPYLAVALEDSAVCRLSSSKTIDMNARLPDFSARIIRLLSRQLESALHTQSLYQGKVNAEAKVIAFLGEVSMKTAPTRPAPSSHLNLSMSRDDIASYLGLTKETLSRVLSRLTDCKRIACSGKKVEILDPDLAPNTS